MEQAIKARYGRPITKEEAEAIKRHLTTADYKKIARQAKYSYSTVNNIVNRIQNITRLNSRVLEYLLTAAYKKAAIKQEQSRIDNNFLTMQVNTLFWEAEQNN